MDEEKPAVANSRTPVLKALASLYRRSKAGREGTTADYVVDFRTLLRTAASEDGEARVRAVEDLRRAEFESIGLLTLDLHLRDSGIIHRVRLKVAGESWLFGYLGERSPSEERQSLEKFFLSRSELYPEIAGWRAWMLNLAKEAADGASVVPFERTNDILNLELINVVGRILKWNGESLIRYASSVICGDSKRLEALQSKLLKALAAVTDDPEASLESFGILKEPRAVNVNGPLTFEFPDGSIDFGLLVGPVAISEWDLKRAVCINSSAAVCLTVENDSVFRELAKRNRGVLLIQTSFPGSATRYLFKNLPHSMSYYHFGDSDPSGFDILRELRKTSGLNIQPIKMEFRPILDSDELSKQEWDMLIRLINDSILHDVRSTLEEMLKANSKGNFEQEALGEAALDELLERWSRKPK